MELLETLKRKINSAEELHSLVKTMKALAAVSIREHEQAVESLKEVCAASSMRKFQPFLLTG